MRTAPLRGIRLRLLILGLLPAYLLLWVAGTGCYGEVFLFDNAIDACLFTMFLESLGIDMSNYTLLVEVTSGVTLLLPEGTLSLSGTGSPNNVAGTARLDVHNNQGSMIERVDVPMMTNGQMHGSTAFPEIMLMPDYRLRAYWRTEGSGNLSNFYGEFNYWDTNFRLTPPSFRFEPATRGAKFTTAFNAEFGIPYAIPAGQLVLEGSVETPEDTRATVPKKVIVEITHLDRNGKTKAKHKQIIKIIARSGAFKSSKKDFKGYDMQPGESVRLRLKPKGGDLDGLNWTLQPTLNF